MTNRTFSDLVECANSECNELLRSVDEAIGAQTEDGVSVISNDISRKLLSSEEVPLADLTRWQMHAGRLVLLKSLFRNHLAIDCVEGIDGRLTIIAGSFDRMESEGLAVRLDKLLVTGYTDHKDQYVGVLHSIFSEMPSIAAMDMNALEQMDDDIEDLLVQPRWEAEILFLSSLVVKHPPGMLAWISEIESHDELLVQILRSWHQRFRQLKPGYRLPRDAGTLCRDRFMHPPEIFPWMWVSLQQEEGRPLNEIFGFSPEEVKKIRRMRTADLDG